MSTSSTVISERIQRYILDGSVEDLRRLLRIAQISGDAARTAFRRVGAQDGWVAIDCSCGPIGALAMLAEIVGPNGHVVGVDFSEPSLRMARSVIALGLDNAEVLAGDVNARAVEGLAGGRFDLAFTRCFLIHQPDPAHTLGRIAELLRPRREGRGPRAAPQPASAVVSPLRGADGILGADPRSDGVSGHAAPHHRRPTGGRLCSRPRGHQPERLFDIVAPQVGFDLHASTLAAAKDRAIQSGRTTEDRVDEFVNDLRAAAHDPHDWVSTPFYLDLALQKPVDASG